MIITGIDKVLSDQTDYGARHPGKCVEEEFCISCHLKLGLRSWGLSANWLAFLRQIDGYQPTTPRTCLLCRCTFSNPAQDKICSSKLVINIRITCVIKLTICLKPDGARAHLS